MGKNSESCVTIVNQLNWEFVSSNMTPVSSKSGTFKPPNVLKFSTSAELMSYLADDRQDDYIRIQQKVNGRINADYVAIAWKNERTYLKDLKHFPQYRKRSYELYHQAARARQHNVATPKQQKLADGVEAEINSSRVVVPVGQTLFHGRYDCDLTNLLPYPSFISTSLNPVVARNSALRRSGMNQVDVKPIVYILTLGCSLPALWGQTGNSLEYELLLPPLLTSVINNQYVGQNFNVIKAEIL